MKFDKRVFLFISLPAGHAERATCQNIFQQESRLKKARMVHYDFSLPCCIVFFNSSC